MNFVNVYEEEDAPLILYSLLKERKSWQCINHHELPSYVDHLKFFYSKHYKEWFLIEVDKHYVGSINLTHDNEIGIWIFEDCSGNNYGEQAIKLLMSKHNGPFYARVNPFNGKSCKMFEDKFNAKRISITYKFE